MEPKTVVSYSLRNKKTGDLVRYRESSNEGGDFCNSTQVELEDTDDEMYPVWTAPNAVHAHLVHKSESTPWYNSCVRTPKFNFDMDDYEVVKVTAVVTMEPCECEPLFMFSSAETVDARETDVKKYFPNFDVKKSKFKRHVFVFMNYDKDDGLPNLESVLKFRNQKAVYKGYVNGEYRVFLDAVEVPSEYKDCVWKGNGCMMLMSPHLDFERN